MEPAVFISYRGEDSNGYGALLYRELTGRFGEDQVFLDAASIAAGTDFVEELVRRVRSARVLLALVGERWLTVADGAGRRRIDDPDDWVRRELSEAFAAGLRVIPVLIDDAELPCESDLPGDLAALSRCQYVRLRRREPMSDLARLAAHLADLDPVLGRAVRDRDRRAQPTAVPWAEQLGLLARASSAQWAAAVNDRRLVHPAPLPMRWCRSRAAVAGPASAAEYARFDPLPGLPVVNGGEPHAGGQDTLHCLYGGLPSGRLVLLGPPGSGKTTAAILLLLDALRYRERASPDERARIPVPVLFTLHGWDPGSGESVTDWMAGKLAETYPMFRGRTGRRAATDLLTAGRMAGFLDGLDEIPECARPGVLRALADAPFRLVLLARTDEAVVAAQRGPLAGAVALDLQPVEPADAATYLLQSLVNPPPAPWRRISDHLTAGDGSGGALSEALTTPLALSLLRDAYGPTDPVGDLLDFTKADDIRDHLLDQAVTAAYTPRPGRPASRYSLATARHTLSYLATQLEAHGTLDLAWWAIPTWIPHRSRMIMGAVTTGFVNSVTNGLTLTLVFGPVLGLLIGVGLGLIHFGMSLSSYSTLRGTPIVPQRIGRLTYRSTARSRALGALSGLSSGLVCGLPLGLVFGLPVGLGSGLSIGLASGLVTATLRGIARRTDVDESPLGPAVVWRQDRNAGLVLVPLWMFAMSLLAVLVVGLVPGLASGLTSRLTVVLSAGGVVALAVALVAVLAGKRVGEAENSPGAASLETALTMVRLSVRHGVPLRLVAFLEDATSRNLLRTVGPVYQFRHATLQARLARPRSWETPADIREARNDPR